MNEIETGGPAFPFAFADESRVSDGMTMRDYFAAKAMAGLLTTRHPDHVGQDGAEVLSSDSYNIADAMLEARK